MRRAVFRALLAAPLLALALPQQASAQGYPSRPVRIVVPYPPGGATDIVARIVAQHLRDALGGAVVVENRPGGGTNLGTEAVVQAAPDGHTLLLGSFANATAKGLFPNLSFDPVRDLTHISQISTASIVMTAAPNIPVTDARGFIEHARARPGQLNVGAAIGSSSHFAAELFRLLAGVELELVTYRGGAAVLQDLAAGRIHLVFDNPQTVVPMSQAGTARLLAVTGRDRSPALPNLPTMQEAGLAGYELYSWYGLHGPARMPAEVVATLERAMARVMNTPDVIERFNVLGITRLGTGSAEFRAFFEAEVAKWTRVIQEAKIVVN